MIEGNWFTMQCARPCHDTLYSSLEVAEKLSAAEQGGHVPTELVPRCPKCGGPMDIHMGAGQRMILDTAAQARFQNFLKTYHGKKLVVLELGIGWRNQLIKAPMMRLVASEPNATYVTTNLGEIYIAANIKEKSFGLDGRLDELLPALREACEAKRFTYFPDIAKPPHVVLLSYTGRLFVYFLLFMDRFNFYTSPEVYATIGMAPKKCWTTPA